ncbi:MAG: hypothetical protein SPI84_04325 [Anaerovoracaceae bacterium]|nr:hypothetical protein [Bacillota bacterium]MDY5975841.1 hypothetical protein [Anaerovoracaceae bacterium]
MFENSSLGFCVLDIIAAAVLAAVCAWGIYRRRKLKEEIKKKS